MNHFSVAHYSKSAFVAVVSSTVIVTLLFGAFFLAEPSISHGQAGPGPFDFTIKQEIIGEASFLVAPNDVTTTGTINGLTGGNASGTTDFSIISNNAAGYIVRISFENNIGANAMMGDVSLSDSIVDYVASSSEPGYGYVDRASAQFAYTVSSDTVGDTDNSFLNDGSACNAGGTGNGTTKATKCWMEPTTTTFDIVTKDSASPSGATSTIEFDITVPSGATPTPIADTYTATATLTLLTQ
jgi:hypothetical protein